MFSPANQPVDGRLKPRKIHAERHARPACATPWTDPTTKLLNSPETRQKDKGAPSNALRHGDIAMSGQYPDRSPSIITEISTTLVTGGIYRGGAALRSLAISVNTPPQPLSWVGQYMEQVGNQDESALFR